ncbi:acyl-coenzyme A oxidase 1 [Cryphonectria parasitica EP155]|uniref:Acyl-coenzyme A oxidase n=1 Tax=Cryphonectria parasitica (strain ATCC 38755 / EP155) TaxID=660469 RepID=A0A9P4Y7Y6_CRYP1|nr:acyl-coenzyme A oxidase 1 [Cryphonectria parasitica EP155]KAF3768130.1 acyl-coenzyme A oxidase 1 [Cryphonectria parasitica EP155]
MPTNPDWVKKLKPAAPQGTDILSGERAKSNVNVDQLADFLFTQKTLQQREELVKILSAEQVFDKSKNYFQGREDRILGSLARGKRLQQLTEKNNWPTEKFEHALQLISEASPLAMHYKMFMPTIREQGTPEQHKLFLEKAQKFEIIGCYAQTELGHGSNVRGLETTATWNPEDKTFTIHSPALTASKWWIGTLGKVANHAVVMAQLVIKGKVLGPHPFIVPIRDSKTHEPLPDVHIGDIGPKFGFNTMDNGFLLLNNVKVPHVNMLARFSRVDPNTSQYIKPPTPALVYGTLTYVRSTIVLESGSVLARGVTIATRYCAVRRQFQDLDAKGKVGENQVLNYSMVQYRLLPLLAATFALHFTGRNMITLYEENQKRLAAGDAPGGSDSQRRPGPEELNAGGDLLADLHSTSCALKSYSSTIAAEGLEVCRRACGGHGYSSFSGIGSYYADYLPTVTWEGDNFMLSQQVARYLLKSARAVLTGKASDNDTTRFLKNFLKRQDVGAAFDVLGSDTELVDAFAWRVAYLTFDALKKRDEEKQPWNSLLVDFYRLSTAHAQYMVVKSFRDALSIDSTTKAGLDQETLAVMHLLYKLFALYTLEKESTEFFSSAATTVKQIALARKQVMKLLEEVRPHAVRLVDAWKFPDWQLDSSLGRYDGKVYEDMFYRASELNPLNEVVFDSNPNSPHLLKKDNRTKSKL